MRITLCLLLSFVFCVDAIAQNVVLEGTVTDSSDVLRLSNAVVSLIRAKDSILVGFARTDSSGHFRLDVPPHPDRYLLMAGLSSYVEYVDTFTFTGQSRNFRIPMTSKAQLLQAFVVSGRVRAVRINGDTVEYNADSFHVRPNASADELLRQLPGFQVDRSGKISVNGQDVQKILVDGEEFFSDDPTLVSQILRADMISTVQFFNKKSAQATFSGINDGRTERTINLRLKEDKKVGSFGKLAAAAGKYYYGNTLYNRFNGSEKITAYAIAANTEDVGLSWKDKNDFEASAGMEYATPLQNLDYWNGQVSAFGFPHVLAAGAHYNNAWAGGQQSVKGELRAGRLNTTENTASNILYLLPGQRLSLSSQEADNHTLVHEKFNTAYKFRLDSLTEMSVNMAGNKTDKRSGKVYTSSTVNEQGLLVNDLSLNTSTTEKGNAFSGDILIARRGRTPGKLLTLGLSTTLNNLNADGSFVSIDSVGNANLTDTASGNHLNQLKQARSDQHRFASDLTYTRSISERSNMVFRYATAFMGTTSALSTFDSQPRNSHGPLDSIYSNNYVFTSASHKAGAHFNLTKKHFSLEAGNDLGFVLMDQSDKFIKTILKRTFTTWSPDATVKYNARNGSIMTSLTYNGNTNIPSILQIQPLTNNADPNNIAVGNPLLKPSFSHVLKYSYINMDFVTRKTIWVDVSYTAVTGEISSSDQVDSFGRRRYQWFNSDYSSTFYGMGNYSWPLSKLLEMAVLGSWNRHRSMNIVNGLNNIIHDESYTGGLFISAKRLNKFDASIRANATWHEDHSSIQQAFSVNFWAIDIRGEGNLTLPWESELHTSCFVNLRQRTANFTGDANTVQWDLWIGKRLLKDQSVFVKAAAMNLLNQGSSINRFASANYIAETRFERIRRYFQLSATWSFSKFPGKGVKK